MSSTGRYVWVAALALIAAAAAIFISPVFRATAQEQDEPNRPHLSLGGAVTKVEIGSRGSYFTLQLRGGSIVKRDLETGEPISHYDTSFVSGANYVKTLDFALDRSEGVHALLACKDEAGTSFWLIRRFDEEGKPADIHFEKPVVGGRLTVDPEGNYQILSFLEGELEQFIERWRAGTPVDNETVSLFHRYSAEGAWIGSYFQTNAPVSFEEFTRFSRVFPSLGQVVATGDGTTFILLSAVDPMDTSALEPKRLFQLDNAGLVKELFPVSPGIRFELHDILNYGEGIALQWIEFDSPHGPLPGVTQSGVSYAPARRIVEVVVERMDDRMHQLELFRQTRRVQALNTEAVVTGAFLPHLPAPRAEFQTRRLQELR